MRRTTHLGYANGAGQRRRDGGVYVEIGARTPWRQFSGGGWVREDPRPLPRSGVPATELLESDSGGVQATSGWVPVWLPVSSTPAMRLTCIPLKRLACATR